MSKNCTIFSEHIQTRERSFGPLMFERPDADKTCEYLNSKTDMFYYWVEELPELNNLFDSIDGISQ